MRKALLIVVILLLVPLPSVSADGETLHLWSEQAPGNGLLWDDSGNLTHVNPNQPIDLHLPEGNWTLVRIIDGIPHLQISRDTVPDLDTAKIDCESI